MQEKSSKIIEFSLKISSRPNKKLGKTEQNPVKLGKTQLNLINPNNT